jgi:hypothetical protein
LQQAINYGLLIHAKGIASGPKIAPRIPQKTGLTPRNLAILWQMNTLAVLNASNK